MDFNSLNFLFIFFPVFLLLFLVTSANYRKWLIFVASIIFYLIFQEQNFLFVLGLIIINYLIIEVLKKDETKINIRKLIFWLAIISNILVLIFFKVATSQTWINTGLITKNNTLPIFQNLLFPVGLSFVAFQILSCLIDSYRSKETAPDNLFDYASYLLFFPKIVLGPIVRFKLFETQFNNLDFSWTRISEGSKRFIKGLAKKTIIADQLAVLVNVGFGLDKPAYPTSIAWLVLIAFFIQIYYDFSGYIDMGLGIAHMIGFDLPENFNSPYLSKNLSEFWRRWHMSLTAWFREYVFFPLEYKRRRVKFFRVETHTILVFLLTGLWHGFTLNFLVWGLIQGLVIVFENSRYGLWIKKLPASIQRTYFLFVVAMSWVMFRSPSIDFALRFYNRLFIFDQNVQLYPFSVSQPIPIINNSIFLILAVGIIGLLPLSTILEKTWLMKLFQSALGKLVIDMGQILILILSITFIVSQNFVPSIYGRF